jgi:hypothetical protein
MLKDFLNNFFAKKEHGDINITIDGVNVSGSIHAKGMKKEDYGQVVNHPINFKAFSSLKISGPFKTVIQQGSVHAVTLEINEKLIPFLKISTVNDVLNIKIEKDILINPTLILNITAPRLDLIDYKGVGKLDIKSFKQSTMKLVKAGAGDGTLNGDFETIQLDILSTGDFSAKISANEAVINKDGAGDCLIEGEIENPVFMIDGTGDFDYMGLHSKVIKINHSSVGSSSFKGSCDTLELISSGVGSIKAREMKASNVTLNATGVGSINVTAINSIVGSSTGVGGVHIYGNPTNARVTKKCIGELVYH